MEIVHFRWCYSSTDEITSDIDASCWYTLLVSKVRFHGMNML